MIHIHGKFYVKSNKASTIFEQKSHVVASRPHQVHISKLIHQTYNESHSGKYFGSISELHLFNVKAAKQMAEYCDSEIVFAAEHSIDARDLFMIACHLIAVHGLGFEEIYLSLKPFHEYLRRCTPLCGDSFECWLRSFCCAKCLDWIDFRVSTEYILGAMPIQIDKFVHDER